MKRFGLFAIVLVTCFFSKDLLAQVRVLGTVPTAGNTSTWVWDESAVLTDREIVPSPPAAFFRMPQDQVLSTEALRKIYPDQDIPEEEFRVLLPALHQEIDTLCLMLYLQLPDYPEEPIVNTVLVTNYGTKNTRYYIDANNNRDYSDDGAPVTFKNNQQYTVVTITVKNKSGFRQRYKYQLPNLNLNESLKEQFVNEQVVQSYETTSIDDRSFMPLSLEKRFNILFGVSAGTGSAEMDFLLANDPVNTVRRNFSVQYSSTIQFMLGASYTFHNFNLGAHMVLENNHSTQQVQYFERELNNQIETNYQPNSGIWPENSTQFGLSLDYNIRLKSNMYFAPTVQYSIYNLSSKKGFFPRGGTGIVNDNTVPYSEAFVNRYKIAYGGKLKFDINRNSILFVEGRYTKTYFDVAEGYFVDSFDLDSFNLDWSQITITVGAEFIIAR